MNDLKKKKSKIMISKKRSYVFYVSQIIFYKNLLINFEFIGLLLLNYV